MGATAFQGRMLRIHLGEEDRWEEAPLYEAIVSVCKELRIAQVMVYRGLEGFGSSAKVHHATKWPFTREAPIVVSVIDTAEQIQRLLPYLDKMVSEGLVAISEVEVIRYGRPAMPHQP